MLSLSLSLSLRACPAALSDCLLASTWCRSRLCQCHHDGELAGVGAGARAVNRAVHTTVAIGGKDVRICNKTYARYLKPNVVKNWDADTRKARDDELLKKVTEYAVARDA